MAETPTETAASAQAGWFSWLSGVRKWPQVAVVAIAALSGMAYADKLPSISTFWPDSKPDLVLQTQIDGLAATVGALTERVKTLEDAAVPPEVPKPKPVTTGSIKKR